MKGQSGRKTKMKELQVKGREKLSLLVQHSTLIIYLERGSAQIEKQSGLGNQV